MIRVSYRPAVGEVVSVEIPEGRELAVLERAHERVFPGGCDASAEAQSEARFRAVIAARKTRRPE